MSAEPTSTPPPRRRARRWGLRSAIGVLVLGLVAVAAGFVLMGRTITAPAWLQAEVEARASQAGLTVVFERMEFVVHKGWRPRVRLAGVDLAAADGTPIVSVSEAEAALSMRALLRGEVQPTVIEVSGVFADLQRAADGRITLSGGAGFNGATREAASLPALIEGLDAVLLDPRLADLRTAEVYGLTLGFADARAGRVWTADGGRLRLDRDGDALTLAADLALLGGGAGVATLEANYASRIGSPAASFGARLGGVRSADIATQGPAFAWLEALQAPISGAVRSGVNADGTLAPLSATLQIGQGALQPNPQTRPIPFDSARSYFTYDSTSGVMQFDELSVVSDWLTLRADGAATLQGDTPGTFSALVGQFSASGLQFNPFDLYDAPIALGATTLDFRLTLDPFELTLGQAWVQDAGTQLLADGALIARQDGWEFALNAHLDSVTRARLLTLWPQNLVPATRSWVTDNLTAAQLSGIDLAMRGQPNQHVGTYLSFDFADAEMRYSRNLPPVQEGRGNASLLRDRFVVVLDGGHVTPPQGGPLDMAGSSFIIPDVTVQGAPPAVVRLDVAGDVTAGLSLLDMEPLRVMSDANLPVDLAEGTLDAAVTLSLPLAKDLRTEDVRFDGIGTLGNMRTDQLVPGHTLAAAQMQVTADNDGVRIAGPGTLSGVPFQAAWTQPLGPEAAGGSRVDGTAELSQRTVQAFNLGLPDDLVSGQGTAQFSVTLPRGAPPQLALLSDLSGLRMGVSALGWSKPASRTGSLRVRAALGEAPQVDELALEAAGLTAAGRIEVTPGGGLARAVFDTVRLGGWLDAPVTLLGRGANAAPEIRVEGGSIDMRNATFGTGGGGGGAAASGPIRLALNRLQIADTIAITDMRGAFVTSGGLDGSFTGRINGGAQISGQALPQNGRTAIRIRSDDAGGVFASSGIIQQARGGDLDLTLLPVGAEGTFDGTLRVTNTRVKDAPAIADLLSAISIVGLLEQLSGDGILFTEVDASFRLTPSVLTLRSASATGPSMGLSMDGRYGIENSIMDMQGVISPVYFLNGIGQIFTRRGEGLIGFNYTLTGLAQDPRVQVNPLSALTPGLFREIFRRPPPQLPDGSPPATPPRAFIVEGAPGADADQAPSPGPASDGYEGR